jgi:HmuY protein
MRSTLLLLAISACGNSANNVGPDLAPACAHTVDCTDQSIQQLSLFRPVNTATVANDASAGSFILTSVDATGGGISPTKAYVYVKFTDSGLMPVAVGDEDAFTSTDWDLAFRRFIIRLNSGISGPSCVTAARTASGTTFDGVTGVPTGLDYRTEEYFTPAPGCTYVPDGSGLNSPGTALQSFWEYPGCVKMTGNVFIIALADGRRVKMQVTRYYTDAAQMECDTMNTIPTPSGAGNVQVKWAFLP